MKTLNQSRYKMKKKHDLNLIQKREKTLFNQNCFICTKITIRLILAFKLIDVFILQ